MVTAGASKFGRIIWDRRRELRWSRPQLARELNTRAGLTTCDGALIYKWETGRHAPKAWLPHLLHVLGLPAGTAALLCPPATATGPSHACENDPLLGLPEAVWDRLQADTLLNMLDASGPVEPDTVRQLAHAWLISEPPQILHQRAGSRVSDSLITEVRIRTNALRRMDDYLGGLDLIAQVTRELRATVNVLREASYTEETGRQLLELAAEQAQLAGWVAADAGLNQQAKRAYTVGVHAAEAAGHRGLGGLNLGGLGYLLAATGDPEHGVVLTRSAAVGAAPYASARERAMIWDRAAWAACLAGREHEAAAALGRVEDAHDAHQPDAREEPDWLYWVCRAESLVMQGQVWTELHRPLRAVPILQAVISGYDHEHARETALYRSWLAAALLDAGEVEEAAAETTRVIDLSTGVTSDRVAKRITLLTEQLTPHTHVPAAREVLDRVREQR
ncbi:transcriptional regulator [Kitasatospora sp. NPDC088556]|uniref:transcriptional regulator n=1 Tax=Kitasatospora sp. NPDC088556 TaxID=3364076 RepID=UPI00381BF58A